MAKSYRQFCPVAKAAEILAERWTPLVIRELLCGSQHFNDLRRGVPLMSPSLLSQRLKSLEHQGLVRRYCDSDGSGSAYRLTPAGEALRPVIEGLGNWGKRWVRREVDSDDLDAGLLMWDIHRRLHIDRFPEQRTVLRFELTDVPSKRRFYYLIVDRGTVDICLKNPGFAVDLYVTVTLRTLTAVWMGEIALDRAMRERSLELYGSQRLCRQFRSWFQLNLFAEVGREARTATAR